MTEEIRPIIIRKKIVKGGGGHHGGAWKVAYADFVTAMMAFFLMLWLLGATTEDQRKGISEYFNPSIPLAAISGGGDGALGGDSLFTEQTKAQNGKGEDDVKLHPTDSVDTPGAAKTAEDVEAELEALNDAMAEAAGDISEHMEIKMTPEGMVIELTDSDNDPLFAVGSTTPSPLLISLIGIVANSFNGVDNNIKIVGHTDSRAYNGVGGYSNWELSTDRANAARRLLIDNQFPRAQISEVSGKADTSHMVEDGLAAQNRRISITILN